MSISLSTSMSSARRLAVGAIGAGAVAGAILFGATPAANAASAVPAPTVGGPYHVAPVWWGHHHHYHQNGGIHIL
jgi:hypothetical protein